MIVVFVLDHWTQWMIKFRGTLQYIAARKNCCCIDDAESIDHICIYSWVSNPSIHYQQKYYKQLYGVHSIASSFLKCENASNTVSIEAIETYSLLFTYAVLNYLLLKWLLMEDLQYF